MNVAVNHWYPKGQDRLRESLGKVGFKGDFIGWKNAYPPGSPTHEQVNYGFKPYAINEAIIRGYDCVLLLDASCWAIRPLEPIFEEIEKTGYVFSDCGWKLGQWCSDRALSKLGLTREYALTLRMISSGFVGLNFRNSKASKFADLWLDFAKNSDTFTGPWKNEQGEASSDSRVLGHRHDQTVASVIIHRLNMNIITSPLYFAYWSPNAHAKTVIVCKGM